MSFTDTRDSLKRISTASWSGNSMTGVISVRWGFDVGRVVHRALTALGPTSRPPNDLDATAVVRTLNGNDIQSYSAASGTLLFTFQRDNGSTATVSIANMLPGSFEQEGENDTGTYAFQQIYQVESSTPAVVITH